MPSYGPKLIFPEQIVGDSDGATEPDYQVTRTLNSESRVALSSKRYRDVSLGGIKLTTAQHEQLQAFVEIVNGDVFLFRDIRAFKMRDEPLGLGDGQRTEFQLLAWRQQQGHYRAFKVTRPCHDYPARYLPGPNGSNGPVFWATNHVQIRINGGLLDTNAFTINRDTGIITFSDAPDVDDQVSATGFYYHLMRLSKFRVPTKPLGGGTWMISGNVELVQPPGEE